MIGTWALVPVKNFRAAKARLSPVLDEEQRSELAESMLLDVVAAVRGTSALSGLALLGGADARRIAAAASLLWLDDAGQADLNAALAHGARALAQRGARALLILPDDLPSLKTADVALLLANHRSGLTVCPARKDGGTNALLLDPPTATGFCFGPNSARLHLEAALAAGLRAQRLPLPGFARDVDHPADLDWLLEHGAGPQTTRTLARFGLQHSAGRPKRAVGRA